MCDEVCELQSSLALKETKWSGKERGYRRTIDEMEKKVSRTVFRTSQL